RRKLSLDKVNISRDGVILSTDLSDVEWAVEIQTCNLTQVRATLVGLALHPAPEKLLVLIETLRLKPERAVQHLKEVWDRAIIKDGTSRFEIIGLPPRGGN